MMPPIATAKQPAVDESTVDESAADDSAVDDQIPPLRDRGRQLPWPVNLYQTAVGKKYVMAITGAGLLGFVIVHMIGNLHLYEGPTQINEYAEALRELGGHLVPRTVVLWAMRIGLIVMFVLHIHSAYSLKEMSRRSSEKAGFMSGAKRYAYKQDFAAASYASRTMRWTGPIIGLYVLFHLADLTWGWWLGDDYVRGDVYSNVVESLSSLPVAAVYVVANIALAVHIYHGIWSMFQTLGVANPHTKKLRRVLAVSIASLVCVGNLSFPVMVQTNVISRDGGSTPAVDSTAADPTEDSASSTALSTATLISGNPTTLSCTPSSAETA